MKNLDHYSNQELREDFAWYNRNIKTVADLGRGLGDVPQAMWDAHDALETELLNRGLIKFN